MTRREGRDSLRRLRSLGREFWLELCEFIEHKGWRAVGYSTAAECLRVELQFTLRHCQRLIAAAGVYADMTRGSHDSPPPAIAERQLRELVPLPTAELRREVWEEAAADGEPTGPEIREIVSHARVQLPVEELCEGIYAPVRQPEEAGGDRGRAGAAGPRCWRVQPTGHLHAIRPGEAIEGRLVKVRAGDVVQFEG